MFRYLLLFQFYLSSLTSFAQVNSHNAEAIDLNNFNLSIKTSDDFYKYINGNWLNNNPIPPGNSSWGTFSVLRQQGSENLKLLIEEIAKNNSALSGSERQMIRDFYLAAMDSVNLEKQGRKTLRFLFAKIDSIRNTDQLATVMGWLQLNFCNAAFRFYKNWDSKNSNQIIALIDQYGGYALPDRNYYLKDDSATKNIRTKYLQHIQNMMQLTGQNVKDARITAGGVLQLETIFAFNNMTTEESRDPQKSYYKMDLQGLIKIAPSFNWKNYFDALGLKNTNEINVVPPEFFRSFAAHVKRNPPLQWKNYLKWCVVHTAAPYLSDSFENENFNFFEKTLKGTSKMKTRWERVIEQEQSYLGWALAKEWVKKYYSPKAKEMVLVMIDDIKNAFRTRIQKLDWMSEETKLKAIDKLNKINVKVGYPDKWESLAGLKISNESYLQNILSYSNFSTSKQVEAVGKPANKNEWGMTPQEVNAYYNAVQNEIVFPAGILQPPFFGENFDAAVNYGAIGCVIAHEFTHAFDDQGGQYDADGNLNNWWTEDDLKKFKERQKLIIAQYNSYTVLDTLHLNGTLTVGENIADLGGVNIAYEAFQIYQQKHGKQPTIDGFIPEQRFFIAWTQIWRQNKTPAALTMQVNTSTTSPSIIRGFAPLSNCQGFIDAFNLKEGDKMVFPKNKRFTIW